MFKRKKSAQESLEYILLLSGAILVSVGIIFVLLQVAESAGEEISQNIQSNFSARECSDGIDNDFDGFVDLGDPQCSGFFDDSESDQLPQGPSCGDGSCDDLEINCPIDCGSPEPRCGDGSCNASEDSSTCTVDCGLSPECSLQTYWNCESEAECTSLDVGGSWCSSGSANFCTTGPCPVYVCSSQSPLSCTSEPDCTGQGLNWCGAYCSGSSCPQCNPQNLGYCDNQIACLNPLNVNPDDEPSIWCGTYCSYVSCDCSVDTFWNCFEQDTCEDAGANWCTDNQSQASCRSTECPVIGPQAVCGNDACEEGEDADNCPLDCFSAPPWNWPVSDNQLDGGGGLTLYVSINPTYYAQSRNVLYQYPMTFHLAFPAGANPDMPFVHSYNPTFSVASYDAQQHYGAFFDFYVSENPQTVFGNYISGGDCRFEDFIGYPAEAIDCDDLPDEAPTVNTYPGQPRRFRVNVSDSNVSTRFADLIVDEAFKRKRPIVYIDNIIHPSTGGLVGTPYITWSHVMNFLSYLRFRLNARRIKTIANVAVSPWGLAANSFRDADMLQNSVDGMEFEFPYNRKFGRQYLNRVLDEMNVYKRWLASGKWVSTSSLEASSSHNNLMERTFNAAMVMMTREQGQSFFVLRPYFYPVSSFQWKDWPLRFGAPVQNSFSSASTGPNQTNWSIKRAFANGNLGVQHVSGPRYNMPVTFTIATPDDSTNPPYTVLDYPEASHGSLDITNWPSVTFTPQEFFSGTEIMRLGSNQVNGFYSNQLVLAVYVPQPECSDGQDNDGDGKKDYSDNPYTRDPQCQNQFDDSEAQ